MERFWGLSGIAWTAIYTLLTFGLLVVAVWAAVYAKRQWEVAQQGLVDVRRAEMETTRPFVIVQVEHLRSDRRAFDLVVRNIGRRPAFDVTVKLTPPPQRSREDSTPMSELRMLNEPISMIAPGQDLRTLWDDHADRHSTDLPWRHAVALSYRDSLGNRFDEEAVLDLAAMCGIQWQTELTIHDAAKSLGEMTAQMKRAVSAQETALRGLIERQNRALEPRRPEAEGGSGPDVQ